MNHLLRSMVDAFLSKHVNEKTVVGIKQLLDIRSLFCAHALWRIQPLLFNVCVVYKKHRKSADCPKCWNKQWQTTKIHGKSTSESWHIIWPIVILYIRSTRKTTKNTTSHTVVRDNQNNLQMNLKYFMSNRTYASNVSLQNHLPSTTSCTRQHANHQMFGHNNVWK